MDGADRCPPSHTHTLHDGIKHSEQEIHFAAGMDHYVRGRLDGLVETLDLCGKRLGDGPAVLLNSRPGARPFLTP